MYKRRDITVAYCRVEHLIFILSFPSNEVFVS